MGNRHGTKHERKLAARKRAAAKKVPKDTRSWTVKTVQKYLDNTPQPQYHLMDLSGERQVGHCTPWAKLGNWYGGTSKGNSLDPKTYTGVIDDCRDFIDECRDYYASKPTLIDDFAFKVFLGICVAYVLLLFSGLGFREYMRSDPQCQQKIVDMFGVMPESAYQFCTAPEDRKAQP